MTNRPRSILAAAVLAAVPAAGDVQAQDTLACPGPGFLQPLMTCRGTPPPRNPVRPRPRNPPGPALLEVPDLMGQAALPEGLMAEITPESLSVSRIDPGYVAHLGEVAKDWNDVIRPDALYLVRPDAGSVPQMSGAVGVVIMGRDLLR